MRQTSTSVANATTDTVTTQSTFMTSTAPAPPPSIHMMRAPEHGVPSGHLHHPYYYAGPPPVQSEMHPAYPHPNFVAQQPQPVMYTGYLRHLSRIIINPGYLIVNRIRLSQVCRQSNIQDINHLHILFTCKVRTPCIHTFSTHINLNQIRDRNHHTTFRAQEQNLCRQLTE
ncbi:hypothetical protein BC830DRAFT_271899 [Chytriomyces sp. MP71]|nr:hypothetical protein BC830DRAFT_271899 [Chytriomyces sp. MP71]